MNPLRLVSSLLLLSCALLRAAVVTTTDNASTPGDGQTSLLEALTNLTAGETISFNIPGVGPHTIVTPVAGYPVITRSGVTIDGYTQPGAAANTAGPAQPRNAVLKIVLDSRTANPAERRTVLNYTGFGAGESCVLGLVDASNVTIRGLAFIGVAGFDNTVDPYVYNIALVNASTGAKVQGCWFGLDPGAPGAVYGARSAVAAFKGSGGINSAGLIFGTDGNGIGDAGEGNVCVGQRVAVHLETPNVQVCGNWFNIFPNGSILNPGQLTLEDGTLEAIENGDGANMRIGTNGDGTSDAEEGNRFGPVVYTVFAEFWRAAVGIAFAGNTVGLDLNGVPAFSSAQGLVFVRKNSSIRIGSDMNGLGDAAEANHVSGLTAPFIFWSSNNNDANGKPARLSLRRNELLGNAGTVPVSALALVTTQRVFADAMVNSAQANVILNAASTTTMLAGTAPLPATGIAAPMLDVYHADPVGLYANAPQGRVWLASFAVDGAGDLDPVAGQFTFDVSALGLTPLALGRLTAAASYTLADGRVVTTNFCAVLAPPTAPAPLDAFRINRTGANALLAWTGGTAPFRLLTATDLAGPWGDLATTSAQSLTTPIDAPQRFYRIAENAPPPPSLTASPGPRKRVRAAKH